jgi:hypothetical protein
LFLVGFLDSLNLSVSQSTTPNEQSVGSVWTVREERFVSGGSVRQFAWSMVLIQTVHGQLTDSLSVQFGWFVPDAVDQSKSLALELCFCFELCWGLFLWLVGPL